VAQSTGENDATTPVSYATPHSRQVIIHGPTSGIHNLTRSVGGRTPPRKISTWTKPLAKRLDSQGVIRRDDALTQVSRHVLDRLLSSGRLVAAQPKIYARSEHQQRRGVRERATVSYAGPTAALSHVSH
jgi:hypothetical protein